MEVTTVNYKGIEIEVHYNYEPEEKGSYDCPVSDECIEIEKIMYKGIDVVEIYNSIADIYDLELLIFKER